MNNFNIKLIACVLGFIFVPAAAMQSIKMKNGIKSLVGCEHFFMLHVYTTDKKFRMPFRMEKRSTKPENLEELLKQAEAPMTILQCGEAVNYPIDLKNKDAIVWVVWRRVNKGFVPVKFTMQELEKILADKKATLVFDRELQGDNGVVTYKVVSAASADDAKAGDAVAAPSEARAK